MAIPMHTALTFISRHYPEQITGKVGGMAMGIGIFGGTVGVVVGSTALHNTGNYQMSIIIVGNIAIIGVINSLNLKPPTVFCGIDELSSKTPNSTINV